MDDSINLKRPHIGFLDGNRIRVDSIIKIEDDEYKISIKVSNDILTKITNIPSNMVVRFEIYNKIDWKVKIIKHSGCGSIKNINKDKDEWICSADLIIKVVK